MINQAIILVLVTAAFEKAIKGIEEMMDYINESNNPITQETEKAFYGLQESKFILYSCHDAYLQKAFSTNQ